MPRIGRTPEPSSLDELPFEQIPLCVISVGVDTTESGLGGSKPVPKTGLMPSDDGTSSQ